MPTPNDPIVEFSHKLSCFGNAAFKCGELVNNPTEYAQQYAVLEAARAQLLELFMQAFAMPD